MSANRKKSEIEVAAHVELQAVARSLDKLNQQVAALQKNLPPQLKRDPRALPSVRRDTLKLHQAIESLKEEYTETLGLDMVDEDTQEQIKDVAAQRNELAGYFVTHNHLSETVKATLKSLKTKLSAELTRDLEGMEKELREVGRQLQAILGQTPSLGMTNAEWEELTVAQRRSLRSPGRPRPPIEAQITLMEEELANSVALANKLSEGSLKTVEDIIKGVQETNRGRPEVSELGKMDRELAGLNRRLEKVLNEPSPMQALKERRLVEQISDLRELIAEKEASLTGMELHMRELEKMRAKHRDLVVDELRSSGEEQAHLLLAIIRNETEQLDIIDQIRKIDPNARVTVTHKVNPGETRERFNRIRMNGRLKDAEMRDVDAMEAKLKAYPFSRNR